MNEFGPYPKKYTKFVVKNICPDRRKVISIFQYPILNGTTRDLLAIPGVSEADIRVSLLKGELNHKLRAGDIIIVESDIDLLQFNLDQKHFLQEGGVVFGLQVTGMNMQALRKEDIVLVGAVNDVNTVFKIPFGSFIQNDDYRIIVYKNGVKQLYLNDYFIAESGGPGTGYDTVILAVAPATIPAPDDVITADYYIDNS
jgi:hypothetical protein